MGLKRQNSSDIQLEEKSRSKFVFLGRIVVSKFDLTHADTDYFLEP